MQVPGLYSMDQMTAGLDGNSDSSGPELHVAEFLVIRSEEEIFCGTYTFSQLAGLHT